MTKTYALISTFFRKSRSALIIFASAIRQSVLISMLKIWQPSLHLGKKVSIGRRVRFKLVSGGKVIIGNGSALEEGVFIHAEGGTIIIGSNSFIGANSQIVAHERITIGNDALIAAMCVVRDADHGFKDLSVPIRLQGHIVHPVEIGDDVWLGAHVVVTAGSVISDGAIIGANAVVRGAIPPFAIATGVPAKVIKQRDTPLVADTSQS